MIDPLLAQLNAAARRGELSAVALVDLFQIMWHGLDAMDVCGSDGQRAAQAALEKLEEPLMALVSEREAGRVVLASDTGFGTEARLDRINRAKDMNATFQQPG
jgi:hypothetical protein